jgi:hypothetical protein
MMKQNRIALILAAGCFGSLAGPAFAGEIDDLKARLEKLEAGQKSGFTTANGTTFSLSGYIQLDAIHDLKGDQGRAVDMTALPLKGSAAAQRKNTTTFSARTSRLNIKSSTPVDGATVKTRIEFDFATPEGSETYTNSARPRLRHAYGQVGNWLAGQTWSTFMDLDSLPETLEFTGPSGQAFIRQPQVRYTLPIGEKSSLAFAVENPQADARDAGGNVTAQDRGPDFAANWTSEGDWGHVSLRGLVRPLRVEDGSANNQASTVGVGGGVAGSLKLGAGDTVLYQVNAGKGIGRYIQDANPAAAYSGAPADLSAQKSAGGFIAVQHAWVGTARSSLVYGATRNSNESGFGSTAGLNKKTREVHANLIFSPYKPVDVGVEYVWGRREQEDGQKGDLSRLQASAKFNF